MVAVTISGTRRMLGPVVVLALTVVGLIVMADATKFHGDTGRTGATQVVFGVETRSYHHNPDDAATSLWVPCIGSVGWEAISMPRRLESTDPLVARSYGGIAYLAEVRPSLGEHTTRRLRGCLEDGTVDKVRGTVFHVDVRR